MSRTSDQSVLLSDDPPLDLRLSDAELETARERIVSFIADLVDEASAEGAVLGLSGGIDSTTVASVRKPVSISDIVSYVLTRLTVKYRRSGDRSLNGGNRASPTGVAYHPVALY